MADVGQVHRAAGPVLLVLVPAAWSLVLGPITMLVVVSWILLCVNDNRREDR